MALVIALISTQTAANVPDEQTPNLAKVFAAARVRQGKRPIILVPGILSTKLINSKTRETVWPSAFRSDDDELSLPINGDPLNSRDNLVATKAIESTRFLPLTPKVNILGGMLDALRNHAGYKEGDWDHPAPDGDRDTFYTFVYDWRLDNVQMAQQLITRLTALKAKLNRPDLRFDVVAISMGGLIARYAAMYGAQDLPANGPPVLNWAGAAHIGKILMFGVPNEGSMEAFVTILNGYSINEGANSPRRLFRKLSRADAFSGLAVFQLMPHRSSARFLNQDLQPLKIDLYDPATWKLYGWSIAHDPKYIKRFTKEDSVSNHSSLSVLEVHLAAILDRTKRFHEALDAPLIGAPPIPLLAFAGDCEDTLNAVVVFYDKKKSRWVTVTSPKELRASNGQTIGRDQVQDAMYVPGDGRVTRASVLGESATARDARPAMPVAHSFFACGGHGSLHNNRILLNNALSILVR